MPNLTFTQHFIASLDWSQRNLTDDLAALTPEQAVARPSSDAPSPVGIAAHCAATARGIAALLGDGARPFQDAQARREYEDGIADLERARAALDAAYAEVRAAILAVGEDRWGETVQGPFGPMSRAAVAALATAHTMYHDGQLNLLDRMGGHTEMRWSVRP